MRYLSLLPLLLLGCGGDDTHIDRPDVQPVGVRIECSTVMLYTGGTRVYAKNTGDELAVNVRVGLTCIDWSGVRTYAPDPDILKPGSTGKFDVLTTSCPGVAWVKWD